MNAFCFLNDDLTSGHGKHKSQSFAIGDTQKYVTPECYGEYFDFSEYGLHGYRDILELIKRFRPNKDILCNIKMGGLVITPDRKNFSSTERTFLWMLDAYKSFCLFRDFSCWSIKRSLISNSNTDQRSLDAFAFYQFFDGDFYNLQMTHFADIAKSAINHIGLYDAVYNLDNSIKLAKTNEKVRKEYFSKAIAYLFENDFKYAVYYALASMEKDSIWDILDTEYNEQNRQFYLMLDNIKRKGDKK